MIRLHDLFAYFRKKARQVLIFKKYKTARKEKEKVMEAGPVGERKGSIRTKMKNGELRFRHFHRINPDNVGF